MSRQHHQKKNYYGQRYKHVSVPDPESGFVSECMSNLEELKEINIFEKAIDQHNERIIQLKKIQDEIKQLIEIEESRITSLTQAKKEGNGKIFLRPSDYDSYLKNRMQMAAIDARRKEVEKEEKKVLDELEKKIKMYWPYLVGEDTKYCNNNERGLDFPFACLEQICLSFDLVLSTNDKWLSAEAVIGEFNGNVELMTKFIHKLKTEIIEYHRHYNLQLVEENAVEHECLNKRCYYECTVVGYGEASNCGKWHSWHVNDSDLLDLTFMNNKIPKGELTYAP